MTDSISKEKRSYIMSMIKGKNTKPEIIVRKYLFHCGFRFRVNVKRLPGTPDIVLRKYKTVIFVNGCFWHGHEGCPEFRPPRSRVEWWTEKLRRNKERDARVREELKAMGWNTMVVWECQLKPAVRQQTLLEMEYFINHTYLEYFKPKRPHLAYPTEEEAPGMAAEDNVAYHTTRPTDVAEKQGQTFPDTLDNA